MEFQVTFLLKQVWEWKVSSLAHTHPNKLHVGILFYLKNFLFKQQSNKTKIK